MDELIGFRQQVCRLGKILKCNTTCPAHLQYEWKQLDDLLVHASMCEQQLCRYRNCYKGKLLYRHILFTCVKNVCKFCQRPNCLRFPHEFEPKGTDTCQLCDNMLHLLRFQACNQSNCIVPSCRENKEKLLKKEQEQRLRRIEEQLKRFFLGLEMERPIDAAALQFSLMLRPRNEGEESREEAFEPFVV